MRRSFTVSCSSHLTCQKTSVLVGHHHPSLQSRSPSVGPPLVSCQLHGPVNYYCQQESAILTFCRFPLELVPIVALEVK